MKKSILLVLVLAFCLTVEVAQADFTFGEPTNLGPAVNDAGEQYGPSVSADGLELYFYMVNPPGGYGSLDLYVTTRQTTDDKWGSPVNLGQTVNSSYWDESPYISRDGLSLYFGSNRPNGYGSLDLYVTTRKTRNDPWGPPVNLGPQINSAYCECVPRVSADGLSLFFSETDVPGTPLLPGGYGGADMWVSTRVSRDAEWGGPVNLGSPVNSASHELAPCISADGLTLLFGRGSYTVADIWLTRRKTTDDPWQQPANLGRPLNLETTWENHPDISDDGSTLYFTSYRRPGGFGGADLWQAPIIPVVDFNSDGIVDSADMCVMVDHWGENYPLCDIGPMPWGDGVVDVQDLIVLAEHLFEEDRLVAQWKLDETEGTFAADSIGDNDAFVVGGAAWQPSGGQVDGALQLNGVDGCAITRPVLNPADGPFSIFVWVNGGAPGQVVVSQEAMADWLAVDAEGNLVTDLKCTGRSAGPLYSETVITDGQWHRIGLVWDGSHRTLYVDGIAVAEDTQPGLQGSQMGLYIGTGKAMEPGTYFSGLIDDVRIYNRAVSP